MAFSGGAGLPAQAKMALPGLRPGFPRFGPRGLPRMNPGLRQFAHVDPVAHPRLSARPARPVAAAAAAVAAQAPAPVTNAPAPSPLDAQYFQQRAQDQFTLGQRLGGLQQQSSNQRTALQEALRQMALQEPRTEQNATNAGNSRGLLYSGALGQQIGNLQTSYLQNQAQRQQAFAQAEAARQSQTGALHQQYDPGGISDLAEQLAAAQRGTTLAATQPLTSPVLPSAAIPRAQGHSTAYTGPGLYRGVGPASAKLRAVGHSGRYRGAGRYVAV